MTNSKQENSPSVTEWGQAEIFNLLDLPHNKIGDTYRQTAVRGDDMSAGIHWFQPEHPAWPAAHNHDFDQLAFVLEGRMRITLADEQFDVEAPSVVWIPRGMPHSADVIGDQPCLTIDVFGNVRPDFEKFYTAQRAYSRGEK